MAVVVGTVDNFEEVVLKKEGRVLVDFNAGWCGPCRMLKPIVDEVAEEGFNVVSVDIDDEDMLAEEYQVSSIPCLVVFENGKEVARNVGFMPKEEVLNLVGDK